VLVTRVVGGVGYSRGTGGFVLKTLHGLYFLGCCTGMCVACCLCVSGGLVRLLGWLVFGYFIYFCSICIVLGVAFGVGCCPGVGVGCTCGR